MQVLAPAPIPDPLGIATPAERGVGRDLLVLLAAFFAIAAWDAIGPDLPITRWFANGSGFALKEHWLFTHVLHDGAKWCAWVVGGLLVVNVWRPFAFARGCSGRVRIWWLATTLACVLLIPLLKQASLTSCPWSLAEFGGTARYVSHWALFQADGGPGGCFLAGHATTGFCFLAGYVALRDSAPVAARRWLIATLAFGALLGAAQVVRGAHFVSHSMWTAWWCWALTVASLRLATMHVGSAKTA